MTITVHASWQAAIEAAKTTNAPAVYGHYNRHSARKSDKYRVVAINEAGASVDHEGSGPTLGIAIMRYMEANKIAE